jgi:hypothetical protein
MKLAAVMVGILLAGWTAAPVAAQVECEAARCAVQQAIGDACSCDSSTNHGQYVSCVAHEVKRLERAGQIPTNCKGKVKRCAARSTCGKPGFVTCQIPIDTCVAGVCANDASLTCTVDADCGTKCKTKSSAQRCTDKGGTVGPSGSCCSSCVVTP